LTEFTSPYSLNTQRGWHTSKLDICYAVFIMQTGITSYQRWAIFEKYKLTP